MGYLRSWLAFGLVATAGCPGSDGSIVTKPRDEVLSVILSPRGGNIRVGESLTETVTIDVRGNLARTATLTSSNPAVATVSSADGITATVVAVSPGTTRITAASTADASKSDAVDVNVRSGVNSLALSPDTVFTRPARTRQLSADVTVESGASNAIDVVSLNAQVATVDANLRVTGVANGQTYVRAVSRVDAGKRDSSLIVVDPCQDVATVAIGTTTTSSVSAASCGGTQERFTFTVGVPSILSVSLDHSFPANFYYLGDQAGYWYAADSTAGAIGRVLLMAAGKYRVQVEAISAAQRGSFSLVVQASSVPSGICSVGATTGIRYSGAPLNDCGYAPTGRPAGTYRSLQFRLIPSLRVAETMTVTVTANGFVPVVESFFGTSAPTQSMAAAGGSTVTHTIVPPSGGGFATVVVTTRDAGQTGTFTVDISGPKAGAVIATNSLGHRVAPELKQ